MALLDPAAEVAESETSETLNDDVSARGSASLLGVLRSLPFDGPGVQRIEGVHAPRRGGGVGLAEGDVTKGGGVAYVVGGWGVVPAPFPDTPPLLQGSVDGDRQRADVGGAEEGRVF